MKTIAQIIRCVKNGYAIINETKKERGAFMKKKILSVILTTALVSSSVMLAGCGGNDSGKPKVRIGYFPNVTHAQALVMKNSQMLENKWGDECEVTWTSFNAGPAETEALFAEEIDIGYIGPVPAVSANAKSMGDVVIISNATNAGAVLLKRKDTGIDSVADLAGKKVAVPQMGNTQHLCLLNIISKNDIQDVEIVASANADIVNLMDNGTIDAALVPEPWGSTIEKKGNVEILLDYDEVFLEGNYPVALVVARKEFVEENPEYVKDFLAAHEEATSTVSSKSDEILQVINSEIEQATGKLLDTEIIKSSFERIVVDSQINKDAVMAFAQISKDEGLIGEVPEVENVFNAEFNK